MASEQLTDSRLRELALFAGCGGGILGGKLLGWRTICAVEINAFCARRLMQRQNEGHLSPFPIWDDVSTFDGLPWRGRIDVVSGGFPCQDISAARSNNRASGKQLGLNGSKSGLWRHMSRVVREVEPGFVIVENSPMLTLRGLGTVLSDMAAMGFNARWGVFDCIGFGADHERERLFIIASHADRAQRKRGGISRRVHTEHTYACGADWWKDKPDLERVANGLAAQMDRLKAIGNGQVPAVVKLAWETLTQ